MIWKLQKNYNGNDLLTSNKEEVPFVALFGGGDSGGGGGGGITPGILQVPSFMIQVIGWWQMNVHVLEYIVW